MEVIGAVRELDGNLYAFSPIHVQGPRGQSDIFVAIVDTGFTGAIALPSQTIEMLGLEWHRDGLLLMGDARRVSVPTFTAKVMWQGMTRTVPVHQTEGEPTLGMELFRDTKLSMEVRENGSVYSETLAPDE